VQEVVPVVAQEEVLVGRADHALDAVQAVARGVAEVGAVSAGQEAIHALRRALVAGEVEAVAAPQLVGTGAALQDVVAVEADQRVAAGKAVDLVGEIGAAQLGAVGVLVVAVGANDDRHGPYFLVRAPAARAPWCPGRVPDGRFTPMSRGWCARLLCCRR
jgi:hypothetical protein